MTETVGGAGATRERQGEPRIRVLPDPDATARAAAELIAESLAAAVEARGRADWATTGGSTPVGIYRHLATPPLRERVPWRGVHVWWGDDRYVPRDHPESNVLPLDEVLLSAAARAGLSGTGEDGISVERGIIPGVLLSPENVHAPRMADAIGRAVGPAGAAAAYERELRGAGLDTDGNGFPIFDVILVGIGPDGHLFSVFPGSPLFDADEWVIGVAAPAHVGPHVPRISLNPWILDAARLPLAVVHGEGKAEVVATIFGDARDVRRWPAQLVRRPGATWLLDEAAAARLPDHLRG